MKIGPTQINEMKADLKRARALLREKGLEESVTRLKTDKPELVEPYKAHLNVSDKGMFLDPWSFRVLVKWADIFKAAENTDEEVQEILDWMCDRLKVDRVVIEVKKTGAHN